MSGPPHIPALDGVRALAAVAVVLTHVGFLTGEVRPSMTGALLARLDIGVALFFALSGFLMLRPWIATAAGDRAHGPALGAYARKRAVRILPAYWLVVTAVLTLEAGRVYRPDLSSTLRVDPATVLQHVFVLQGLTGDYFSTFSQTWSLTTELMFYVAVPLIGLGLVRACRRTEDRTERLRAVQYGCLGFIVLGVATSAFSASELPGSSAALATSLLGHAGWFAVGALVCARTMGANTTPSGRGADERLGLAAVLLVLAASPLGGNLLFEKASVLQVSIRELLYTAVAALVMSAACRRRDQPSVALRVLSSVPMVWVGERSYALFLWHLPIAFGLMTVLRHDLFEGSFVVMTVLTLACSLVVADLSWRLVERPLMAANVRRDQRRREQRDEQQTARLGDDGHQ